jgi:hypothetical protein
MSRPGRVPLWLKLVYSAFVAVLVPCYWVTYTPWNFLFFCDAALLITLVALWREDPLLASIPAVGITLAQILWVIDFCAGGRLLGIAAYMFDPKLPLYLRALSSFHGWLPFLLIWLIWRLRYDRRALPIQIALTWLLVLVAYHFGPAPPAPADRPNMAVNINYVYGPGFERPQSWMAPRLWVVALMVLLPALLYIPTHFALCWGFPTGLMEPISSKNNATLDENSPGAGLKTR